MVNYGNGKIYKLVNNIDDKIYVGSTCNPLSKRKNEHKSKCSKNVNRKVYNHLNTIGFEHVEIILIEAYECKNKDELRARERHWIDELKPDLNIQLPTRTQKEWKEEHKEHVSNQSKEYYEKTKQAKLLIQKEKFTCECGGKYTKYKKYIHENSKKHKNYVNNQ